MKKLFFFLLIFTVMSGLIFAQSAVKMDAAIKKAVQDLETRLAPGSLVVVLNFNSPTERFSNFVLDELVDKLVQSGKLKVVDRQNLALIQQEMDFQMSGEVSDRSAQEIGNKLGAQTIISGSLVDLGKTYQIRFRAIEVLTASIQAQSSSVIKKDSQTASLLSTGTTVTGYPRGLNYSTGRKIAAGFLNPFLGIGSFTMGDWVGGLIIGGVEAVGIGLIGVGAISMEENIGFFMLPGMIMYVGGVIYGFIRPFNYDVSLAKKNGTYVASNPMENIIVALVPGRDGIKGVHLGYSFKF